MNTQTTQKKLPVTVLSGFLGSGKTALHTKAHRMPFFNWQDSIISPLDEHSQHHKET